MPEPVKEVIPMIQKLAYEAGKKPWDWLITDDHVTIVFMDGTKQRFERINKMPTSKPNPAVSAAVNIAETALNKPKGKPRTSKKK